MTSRTRPATVPALLQHAASAHGNRIAIIDAEGTKDAANTLSHAELLAQVTQVAHQLSAQLATPARPRIALVLPNGTALTRALLAVTLIGQAAPLSPRLTQAEFANDFKALRPDAVILAPDADAAKAAAVAADVPILNMDTSQAPTTPPAPLVAQPDDIALVLMTSGSTGRAKIVPLSHRNVCTSAADVAGSVALGPQDRALVMWEQFHIGGLVDLLLAPLSVGGSLVITSGFDAARFFDLLHDTKPTWFQALPTTFGELVRHGTAAGFDGASSLRFVRSVAAALTPEGQAAITDLFAVPVIRTLGMTEAGPLITSTALPPAIEKPGSVGQAAGPKVRILASDGTPCPTGAHGEVVVRGDNVFNGYDTAQDNAAAFIDGWFRTGDIGYFDADGDLFLTGRSKDMINRGGEKVSPAEVDNALSQIPGVYEAASFAVPHATLGEDVAAAIVADPSLDLDAVRRTLATRLAAHKIPGQIQRLDALPKTPVGKLDRPALAQAAADATPLGPPPKSGLEAMLAGIWAAELGKPVLDSTTDFAAMDGDSLSAVRVVAATEQALDTVLPDDVFDHVITIAGMAGFLEMHGYKAPEQTPSEALAVANDSLLYKLNGFAPDFHDQITTALANCRSRVGSEAVFRALERFTTDQDLAAVMQTVRAARPGSAVRKGLVLKDWLRPFALRQQRRDWLQKITAEQADLRTSRWEKQAFAPWGFIYADPRGQVVDKTLIVGFAGNAGQLAMPVRWILGALDPMRFDLALCVDPAKDLFVGGAPTQGHDLISTAQAVDRHFASHGYRCIIALGHSAGAPMAAVAALANGWSRGIAVVPPRMSEHPALAAQVEAAGAIYAESATNLVLVRGTRQKEMQAIRQIRPLLPKAKVHVEPENTKSVLHRAYLAGTLPALMTTLLTGDT